MKRFLRGAIASSAVLASLTYAESLPKVLDVPIGAGMKVVKSFPAEGGLQGWVLMKGVQKIVAYTTPDGDHMLIGRLIDATDTNLTLKHVEKHIIDSDDGTDRP
jgi:thiol:disulfide interchange protein DsbG